MPSLIGDRPAAAAEVRVDRSEIVVVLVPVTPAGIGLPEFDQYIGDRAPTSIQHLTVDDDPLANRPNVAFLELAEPEAHTELLIVHRPADMSPLKRRFLLLAGPPG